MKKFALCLLALCTALVPIGGLAAPCWAADQTVADGADTDTIKTAIENAYGGTLTFAKGGKYTLTEQLEINGSITLEGNGATLDGNDACRVIEIKPNGSSDTITVTIRNFTIKNGNANMSTYDNHNGGGIHIFHDKASVTVENCVFDHNTAAEGGGLHLDVDSVTSTLKTSVTKCTFINNVATSAGMANGGGVYAYPPLNCTFTMENCTFTDNSANGDGGGALLSTNNSGNITVNYCTFSGNAATGQGAEIFADSAVTVKNSIIHGSFKNVTLDTTDLNLDSTTKLTAVSEDITAEKGAMPVTHTFFNKYAELYKAVGKVRRDNNIRKDQLDKDREESTTIGAVEIARPKFTVTCDGKTEINVSATAGTALNEKPLTFTADPAEGYTYKWSVATGTNGNGGIGAEVKPDSSKPYTGVLTLTGTPATEGTYTFTVTASAHTEDTATATVSVAVAAAAKPDDGKGGKDDKPTPARTVLTITAKDQTVRQGGSIATGTDQVTASGLLSGHMLSSVNLTADTSKVTTSGVITPGAAKILDGSKKDVTANYDIKYVEGKLTVTAPAPATETFTPVSLTDSKARVEFTAAPGETKEAAVSFTLTLQGSNGTVRENSDGYLLGCSGGGGWATARVDGWKITFSASPASAGDNGKRAVFKIWAEKDGKKYCERNYEVSINVVSGKYELTVAPATMTVLLGASGTLDLSNCVKFEKVYSNGERQTVTPKLSFKVVKTPDKMRMDGWFTLSENGVATATKAPDLFSSASYSGTVQYEVTAAADGNTATKTGTLKVAVEKKLEPVKITTTTLPQPEQNKSYSQQLKAQGEEPIKWEIVKGELPRGLKLDTNTGRIFGTPLRTRVADIKKILSDNAGSSSEFTVRARSTNPSYPSGSSESFHEKTFNFATAIADQKPSGWTQTYDDIINPSTLRWSITFKTKKGTNVTYTHDDPGSSLRSPYLVDVRTGSGNIRFTLAGMRNEYAKPRIYYQPHEYNFLVMGKNSAGTAHLNTTYKLEEIGGGIHQWGPALGTSAQGAIVSVSDGGTDGETGDAPSASVTYFTNGSAGTDENGETIISAVIGKPVGNVEEGKDYVYKDVPTMLNALKDSEDKIVSVEFREGTTVEGLDKLHNLSELAIDMCALTSLDLRGNTKLKKLSLFGCENLKTLNASGCSVLASLNVTECPALADVDLSGNVSLDVLDANDCWALKTLDLTGCAALTDVFLNSADITSLDLSACSGLKALSLEDASKLETLTLPAGASFDNFTLTGSRVASLTLKGTEELTSLDLSRNAEMTKLDLSGCSALSELDVSGCSELRSLDVSGCPELEKLMGHDCAKLYTMDLGDGNKLRELGVGGCTELRALDVSGKALGYLDLDGLTWLLDVNCSGQFIGDIDLSQPLNLKDYAGNNLGCVSDVQGYGADGAPVKTEFNENTGDVTFASVPEHVSYAYDTGLQGYVLGVTVSSSNDPNSAPTSDRDGGGCDTLSGGLLALAALTARLLSLRGAIASRRSAGRLCRSEA